MIKYELLNSTVQTVPCNTLHGTGTDKVMVTGGLSTIPYSPAG